MSILSIFSPKLPNFGLKCPSFLSFSPKLHIILGCKLQKNERTTYFHSRNDIKPCWWLFSPANIYFLQIWSSNMPLPWGCPIQSTHVFPQVHVNNLWATLAFGDNYFFITINIWNIFLAVSSNPLRWSTRIVIQALIAPMPSGLIAPLYIWHAFLCFKIKHSCWMSFKIIKSKLHQGIQIR